MQRAKRQQKILEIIASKEIDTQEELCDELNKSNFRVTQATISRDVKELKLYKVAGVQKKYRYAKKDPNNYKIMTTYGSMESALRYAEAKHLEYADSRYANQNPCTTIYQLVRQLLGRDEKLNAELIARIGENEL